MQILGTYHECKYENEQHPVFGYHGSFFSQNGVKIGFFFPPWKSESPQRAALSHAGSGKVNYFFTSFGRCVQEIEKSQTNLLEPR